MEQSLRWEKITEKSFGDQNQDVVTPQMTHLMDFLDR